MVSPSRPEGIPAVEAHPVDEPPASGAIRKVRGVLAPSTAELTRTLAELHIESAQEQRRARRHLAKYRAELRRRLKGITHEIDGTGAVVVSIVTTGELVNAMRAEADVMKVEAMAQRSYDVHAALVNGPGGGSNGAGFEEWLALQAAADADLEP